MDDSYPNLSNPHTSYANHLPPFLPITIHPQTQKTHSQNHLATPPQTTTQPSQRLSDNLMQLAIHYPLPTCPSPTTPQLQFAPSPRQVPGQNLARRTCMSHPLPLSTVRTITSPTASQPASQPALVLARFGPPTPLGSNPRPSPSFSMPRRPTDPRQVLGRGETMTRPYLPSPCTAVHQWSPPSHLQRENEDDDGPGRKCRQTAKAGRRRVSTNMC